MANGIKSGSEYTSQFAAVGSVVDMATVIFGSVAANKYARPSAFIKSDDVVVEEQNAGDGWKLLLYAGGILSLFIGGIIVLSRKAK